MKGVFTCRLFYVTEVSMDRNGVYRTPKAPLEGTKKERDPAH